MAYDDDAANPIFGTRHSIGPSTHLSCGPFASAYMSYPDHGPSESRRSKPYSHYFDSFVFGSSTGSLPSIGASNIVQEDVALVSSTLSVLFELTWYPDSWATTHMLSVARTMDQVKWL